MELVLLECDWFSAPQYHDHLLSLADDMFANLLIPHFHLLDSFDQLRYWEIHQWCVQISAVIDHH